MGPLLGPRIVEIKLDYFRSGEGWRRGSTESYRDSVSGKLVKGTLGVREGREERKRWLWRRLEAGGHSSDCGETCEIFLRERFVIEYRITREVIQPTGAGAGVAPISALERRPTSLKAPAAVAASQAGLFSGTLNSRVFLRCEDHQIPKEKKDHYDTYSY